MAKKDKKAGLFTKAALEKLSSPEQLDVMMEVTKPKGWIALSAIGFVLGIIILWSIFGSIPTTVDGQGILMRGGSLVDVEAKTEGSIEQVLVQTGDTVELGQPILVVSQGGLQVQINDLKDEITEKTREFDALKEQARKDLNLQKRILDQKKSTLELELKGDEATTLRMEKAFDREVDLLNRGLGTRAKVTAAQNALSIAANSLLRKQRDITAIPGQIATLDSQNSQAELTHALELSDLKRDLAGKERARQSATKVLSTRSGRVIELRVRAGTLVTSKTVVVSLEEFDMEEKETGQLQSMSSLYTGTIVEIAPVGTFVKEEGRLATVMVDGEPKAIVASQSGKIVKTLLEPNQAVKESDLLVHFQPMTVTPTPKALQGVFYVPAGEGKHIKNGHLVRITPSTVKAEEFGFMLGEVASISTYPITPQGMEETLKNPALAQEFAGEGSPLEVNADLQSSTENFSGYQWSSGRGPEIGIQGGTKCTVSIVVEKRRPISYVLPILKGAVGL